MIDIQSLPFHQEVVKHSNIDSSKFDYSKPIDPVTKIIQSSLLSSDEKINQIQRYLVDKCAIIDGSFAKYLAILTLGDKMLIGRYKKKNRSVSKKKSKKKRKI